MVRVSARSGGWSESHHGATQRDGTKKADSFNYLLFLWRLAQKIYESMTYASKD